MANTIPSTLTVVNETDVRGQALLALITQYLTINGYYGFRSLGTSNIAFPVVMVDPNSQKAEMKRLGKYDINITFNIYFYLQESSPDAIVSQSTFIGEALIKLFSNNALGDLGTANTSKFKTYPNPNGGYYWLNSEMSRITWSTSYLSAEPDLQQTYMRAGMMRFEMMDTVTK